MRRWDRFGEPGEGRLSFVSTQVVGRWTIEEFFRDLRPPTDDDVPIALDGTPLDTADKVLAYLREIDAVREANERRVG